MYLQHKKWLKLACSVVFAAVALTGCIAGEELEREMTEKAEKGDPQAQLGLALMYFQSNGVDHSDRKGVFWLRKAAEQGYAEAQANLGDVYQIGLATRKNLVEADKWYTLAAKQEFGRGIRDMKTLERKMTPEQIEMAKTLARAWRPNKL